MGKYNLWLDWESYKIRHPEMLQVLEWQDSLEDIAVYAVIALYMQACYEDECKVSHEADI